MNRVRWYSRVTRVTDNNFVRNIGFLSVSLLATRVLRLAITVVMARMFTPLDYGQIALIFTVHEMLAILLQRCTQVPLVRATSERLPRLCRTTFILNHYLGVGLFILQWLVGAAIAHAYQSPELWVPIGVLGVAHMILPLGMVQAALNTREGNMKLVARVDIVQTVAETVSVLMLIALGAGIWSLVIPKAVAPLIWALMHRRHQSWRFQLNQPGTAIGESLREGGSLLVVDGLTVARQHIDYLLIGFFLGVEALGLYFFAFNAGLGIASTFATAINGAFLPHVCAAGAEASERHRRFRSGVTLIALSITVLVSIQAGFAFLYVPIIFGAHWVEQGALPLITVLCFVAIPKTIFEACSQYLRALDLDALDVRFHSGVTVIFGVVCVMAAQISLQAVAWVTLATFGAGALWMLLFCIRKSRPEPLAALSVPG